VSTEVAQILSTLNGEGTNPEIFISRLALGANRIARGDHDKIYQVHHDFMEDVVYPPFLSSTQIDIPMEIMMSIIKVIKLNDFMILII
jgi:hypothetical protein